MDENRRARTRMAPPAPHPPSLAREALPRQTPEAAAGRLDPERISEKSFRRFLDEPEIPDVDLFVRSSGEQRTSNFLIWQSAYAEYVFTDTLWPDFGPEELRSAIEEYARRRRRFGGR